MASFFFALIIERQTSKSHLPAENNGESSAFYSNPQAGPKQMPSQPWQDRTSQETSGNEAVHLKG